MIWIFCAYKKLVYKKKIFNVSFLPPSSCHIADFFQSNVFCSFKFLTELAWMKIYKWFFWACNTIRFLKEKSKFEKFADCSNLEEIFGIHWTNVKNLPVLCLFKTVLIVNFKAFQIKLILAKSVDKNAV